LGVEFTHLLAYDVRRMLTSSLLLRECKLIVRILMCHQGEFITNDVIIKL